MRWTPTTLCLTACLVLAALGACSGGGNSEPTPKPAEAQPAAKPAEAKPAADKSAKAPVAPASDTEASAGAATAAHPGLLDPSQATGQAPDKYAVKFSTTKGDFVIDVHREWAPLGADRFYNLVRIGYFDGVAFFRVVDGFMAQVGIHGDPRVNAAWRNQRIPDDPVTQSNQRGFVTFATTGPGGRVNQFFINYGDNQRLDPMGFAPFGKVRDMKAVDALYSGYGEGAPSGRGPSQQMMHMRGNTYLKAKFPELDYIEKATLIEP